MLLNMFLNSGSLWKRLLKELVKELATQKAGQVAAAYAKAALAIVRQRGLKQPKAIIDAVLDMVEDKQGWSNETVKAALFLARTTRSKVKARFREASLERIREKKLTKPADIVGETVAVVREKQGWDDFSR